MAKTLDQLPLLSQPIQGTDIILIKTVIDAVPLDFKISVDTFLQNYVQQSEIGTEINDIIRLVDDGAGNAGLPAVSAALLTNINIPDATGGTRGSVFLSDSITSGNDVTSGFAATSKAVRDVNNASLKKAGDTATGNIVFVNDTGINFNNFAGSPFTGIKVTTSDDIEIGQVGTTADNVKVLAQTAFKVCDNAGADVFVFNSDGSSTGLTSNHIAFTPYTYVTATEVQTAIQQVADAALTSGGGTVDGPITFGNNLGVSTRNAADTANISTIYMNNADRIIVGQTGVNSPDSFRVITQNGVDVIDSSGSTIFSFNTDGSSSGIRGQDTSFSPTGTISATNVSAAINELDSEKQAATGAITRPNNVAYRGQLVDTTPIELVKINSTDEVQIGESAAGNIVTRCSGDFIVKNSAGSNLFRVDQNGVIYGLVAEEVTYTPYGTIAANTVSGALNELADEKFDKSGGTLTSTLIFPNNISIRGTKTNASQVDLIQLNSSNHLNIGSTANAISDIDVYVSDNFTVRNELGTALFTVNWDGTTSGIVAGDTAFTPTGNIAASNVQDALVELDTEKLGATATAANSNQLGGVNSSNFARSDIADAFFGTMDFNAGLRVPDLDNVYLGSSNDVQLNYNGTTNIGQMILNAAVTNFEIKDGGTTRFTFGKTTGNFTATGNITAFSDLRVKENIKPILDPLGKVSVLNGCTYDRTDIVTKRQTGLIAQEVLKVLPEAVSEDENGNLSVAYGNMTGLLVEAIKELKKEVEELKKPKRKFEWLYKILARLVRAI